jgi:predicted NUDIX family NTP pyrophosphohydrolase
MPRRSAGIALYRRSPDGLEVLIAHPGGPLWAKKDEGFWTFPKGEYEPDESAEEAAVREFEEELGHPLPAGPRVLLGEVRQRGGKLVTVWAVEGTLDAETVVSNTFEMEWPPRSGRRAAFPEIDRAEWADVATARRKLKEVQVAFVDRLEEFLATP